jgi:hypothetical protein
MVVLSDRPVTLRHDESATSRREDVLVALLQEDIHDRRWARLRDQLLTFCAIAAIILAVLFRLPELGALAALPAAPRAFHWRFDWKRLRARA